MHYQIYEVSGLYQWLKNLVSNRNPTLPGIEIPDTRELRNHLSQKLWRPSGPGDFQLSNKWATQLISSLSMTVVSIAVIDSREHLISPPITIMYD